MPQRPRILPKTRALPQGSSYDSSNITMDGEYPLAPPLAPLPPGSLQLTNSFMASASTSARDWSPFRPGQLLSQAQEHLPEKTPAQIRQPSSQPLIRKRAPKSRTMSAEMWRLCEGRLRQLYVHDRTPIRELRQIVNKEFGFTATERQYISQINKMKLERNVKEKDQKAVVRRILYRTHAIDKKSSHVRVKGHKISPENIARWMKGAVTEEPLAPTMPPSPLPSYVSIYTGSTCASPKLLPSALPEYPVQSLRFMGPKEKESTAIQRLLKYSRDPAQTLKSQEARAMFNDLQVILSCAHDTGRTTKRCDHGCNPIIEEDIVEVRNLMNMIQELVLSSERVAIKKEDSSSRRRHHRHAAWMTPYGLVQIESWAVSNRCSRSAGIEDTADTTSRDSATSVAFIPVDTKPQSFRVVFDFASHLNLSANILYQAMIPNDSEVFDIVASGDVKKLIRAIETGTASLTDRDQKGRSLLNYAMWNSRADMCRFLVAEKADVDSIESDHCNIGFGPVHDIIALNYAEAEEDERTRATECLKIMLEAGADVSIEYHEENNHGNTFIEATMTKSFLAFKHILDYGEPFISLNETYRTYWQPGGDTALMLLADLAGYYPRNSVDVNDKAILLLRRGADISCRRNNGDTVLHTVLKCYRLHELESKAKTYNKRAWNLSLRSPKELLIAFITAGADVYATNNEGDTASMVATMYGRYEEWTEALEICGFDTKQVLRHLKRGLQDCSCERQTSTLSFEEYCLRRKANTVFEETGTDDEDEGICETIEEEDSDETDDEEEENSDDGDYHCPLHSKKRTSLSEEEEESDDEDIESYCGPEFPTDCMDLDIENAGGNELVGSIEDHVAQPDYTGSENLIERDLAYDISVGSQEDIMEDCFDFGRYLDASL